MVYRFLDVCCILKIQHCFQMRVYFTNDLFATKAEENSTLPESVVCNLHQFGFLLERKNYTFLHGQTLHRDKVAVQFEIDIASQVYQTISPWFWTFSLYVSQRYYSLATMINFFIMLV